MTDPLTKSEQDVLTALLGISRELEPMGAAGSLAGADEDTARVDDFASAISDQLGVTIPPEQLARLGSLEDISRFIADSLDSPLDDR